MIEGDSSGSFWTKLNGVTQKQNLALLGEIHARVLAWKGTEHTGLHWTRSTGSTGGSDGRRAAIYFSKAPPESTRSPAQTTASNGGFSSPEHTRIDAAQSVIQDQYQYQRLNKAIKKQGRDAIANALMSHAILDQFALTDAYGFDHGQREAAVAKMVESHGQNDLEAYARDFAGDGGGAGPKFSKSGPLTPQEAEFRATEQAYGGRDAYERSRAEGKTKLGYGQWVQVRTPSFKKWFGDWEMAGKAIILTSSPTSRLGRAAIKNLFKVF